MISRKGHRIRRKNEHDRQRTYGARFKEDRKFSLVSASLRQALQEISKIAEESRSMLPEGSKQPYEHTRMLIEKLAPALKTIPYRISITGQTASSKVPLKPGYGPGELSADRANAVRKILASLPSGNVYMVAGKADTEPLFPDNP